MPWFILLLNLIAQTDCAEKERRVVQALVIQDMHSQGESKKKTPELGSNQ
jgi:hypothetical protein